jgi:serine/threonine protein kinase
MNAHKVLERIAELLIKSGVQFKGPSSLAEVQRLNTGLNSSYGQVGKIFTVYPRNSEEAMLLAKLLHHLTRHLTAPEVPFDTRFRRKGIVSYRYGAFKLMELEVADGVRVSAIKDPQGRLIPDLCQPGKANPKWSTDPFPRKRAGSSVVPGDTPFRILRALSQRGKGGVYQAIDLSAEPPRLCLLKEGRKSGELGWDGKDGRWKVRHEETVLSILRDRGVDVPRVYSSFEQGGNYYLVTEYINGESLHSFLLRRQRRIPVARALSLAIQLARFVAQIHAGGWVWRDCKPANLILTRRGDLRSLDFEGACPIDRPNVTRWMTPAFTPSMMSSTSGAPSIMRDDLYALGAVAYLLLTGRIPDKVGGVIPVTKLRKNTPREVCELVTTLLDSNTPEQLTALEVSQQLTSFLNRIGDRTTE